MMFLAGYTIQKPVFIGSKSAYYSAERKKDGRPLTVKVAVGATAEDRARERFGYERNLLNLLKILGVPRCYGIERYRSSFALVLESLPGACVAGGNGAKRFHLRDTLTVGSRMAAILAGLPLTPCEVNTRIPVTASGEVMPRRRKLKEAWKP